MAYEYNPNSARFDIPNPHRIENVFIGICGVACFVAGIWLLVEARTNYFERDPARFAKSIVSALSLLALAISFAYVVMQQLRFFFGRGQPADLVPSLSGDEIGYRPADGSGRQIGDAAVLRQTLQQNAITYRIPKGPIDSFLYSIVRSLVYSPRLTQDRVRAQFRNLLAITFVLLLFAVSLLGIRNAAAIGWIGWFYFFLTNAVVLQPIFGGRLRRVQFSERLVVGFIALAIVMPAIFASLVPPRGYTLAPYIDIVPVTFLILVTAFSVTLLLFRAGIANTIKPTQIAIAPHLETPSVNVSPEQIYTELKRELQRQWQEQVPNRTYMRRLPDVSARQGAFSADVIEETQPIPVDVQPMTFERAFALSTTRPLVIVDVVCAALTILGVLLVCAGTRGYTSYDSLVAGGASVLVGAAGIRSANDFWRRFEFTSRIYWIDWNGTYARAATKIGALLTDRVHTEREVISVESMTLRVWVAELDSVAFNTDQDRDLVAIRGLPLEAERLGRWLSAFAYNQGSIMAPTSAVDVARMEAINTLNVDPMAETAHVPRIDPALQSGIRTGAVTPPLHRFCVSCGAKAAAAGALFCSSCGAKLL